TRIKILSQAGIKWAEIAIPFYEKGGQKEKIYEVVAFAYNLENGNVKKTSLDVSNTYDEKISNYWRIKKFAIPNVQVGSIIEYSYTMKSPYIFNLNDWDFQQRIPVLYSEYQVKMIPFYTYVMVL